MSKLIKANLKITVQAFDKPLKEKATVHLSSLGDKKNISTVKLNYNKLQNVFEASNIQPGAYVLKAESKDYEAQEREINLSSSDVEETFILGKKGMAFYYRGKVKVPFKKNDKLIGATLEGKNIDDFGKAVTDAARKIGLSPVEASDHIRDNKVMVFNISGKKSSDSDKDDIVRQLEAVDGVKFAGPVIYFDKVSVSFLTREIIVKFKSEVAKDKISGIAREYNCTVQRPITYLGNGWLFRILSPPSFAILDICEKLVKSNLVEYAEPNLAFTVVNDFVPNDFLYTQQGHHQVIDSEAAWDVTQGVNSVVISVVDAGFDVAHPDFQNPMGAGWTKIYSPFDFAGMDTNPLGISHGVESSGIATALGNNSEGISGVAPGCVLLPVRYPSGGTDLNYSDMYIWVAGFNPNSTTPGFPAPIAPGADVVSNSFGIYQAAISGIMKDTFDYLTSYGRNGKGCIIVFSVGNDNVDFNNGGGGGTGRKWASYARTIAVAASTISPPDAAEIKATTSNFGLNLDVCAPAGNSSGTQTRSISSYNVGGGTLAGTMGGASLDYGSFGQTSCACPQVSGTIALMLSANPSLTWIDVRNILRNTAQKIDFANVNPTGLYVDLDTDGINEYSQWYGYGRLDASAAVLAASTFVSNSEIVVRDNLMDVGIVPVAGAFWASPDVWVRTVDPAVDGAMALPANYLSAPPHQDADRTIDNNWIYVRMKNVGTAASGSFYVRVYLAHWAGTEFIFPNDFIPTNNPGNPIPSPMTPGTYLIGETFVNSLGLMTESIINMKWDIGKVPPSVVTVGGVDVHWHPCLLVHISPFSGPSPSGNHVWDSNNLAQRNITIVGMNDDATDDFNVGFVAGNLNNSSQTVELEIDRAKLPEGVKLFVQVMDERIMNWIINGQYRKQPKFNDNSSELQLLTDTKAVLKFNDINCKVSLTLARNSSISLCSCSPDSVSSLNSFKPGKYKGRPVLFLDNKEKIRIPILRMYTKVVPVIIGGIVESKPEPGVYDVIVNQYDFKDVVSGSYGVRLYF